MNHSPDDDRMRLQAPVIETGEYESLLDTASLAKIGHLELLSMNVVDGMLSGKHRSKQKGGCFEFAEHRAYTKGDEIRLIDWRAVAKTDRYYIKQFEEETNLQAVTVVDCSGSMDFSLSTVSKLDYARMASACLTRLILRQRDSVGLAIVDSHLRQFIPPRARASHLTAILETLRNVAPRGSTSLASSLLQLAKRLRRRGVIIVFSDFLTELKPLSSAVRQLRVRGHEVLLFHIMAPEELDLPFKKWTRFECLETRGVYLDLDAPTVRKEYRTRVQTFLHDVRQEFTALGCDYELTTTDQFLGDVLARYLTRRAARTRSY
jgi:uncharacterized protein (DUF58 family)